LQTDGKIREKHIFPGSKIDWRPEERGGKKYMNTINDLDGELAYAVLIEKKHSEKINSAEIIPLIRRLNEALRSISSKEDKVRAMSPGAKNPQGFSH
jgi:hypothetical protein